MGTTPTRTRWADKFREPTREELLTGITDRAHAGAVGLASEHLLAIVNVKEQVQWLATPWRWTMVYSCDMDPTRALTYLVPDPAKPQICVPLTTAMMQAMPLRRLKKNVREGIIYSKVVAGTFWPTWDLTNRTTAEDVLDLVNRKHKYIHVGQESLAGMA